MSDSVALKNKEQELKSSIQCETSSYSVTYRRSYHCFFLFNFLTHGRLLSYLLFGYVSSLRHYDCFNVSSILHHDYGRSDFSQGSILGLSAIVICVPEYGLTIAIIGGILTGAAIGAINGYFSCTQKD